MKQNKISNFLHVLLILSLGMTGCAGVDNISREIQQDKLEARQEIEQRQKNYQEREYLGLTSENSDNWNSTDWSMWMDTHGGR